MKSSQIIVLLTLGVATSQAHACIHFIDDGPLAPPVPLSLKERLLQHISSGEWQNRVAHWQPIADKEWNFQSQNNLAASLAHVGRYDEALQRLQAIERVLPSHPFTAYNMGTVYELQGDLPRALKWIKAGVARERNSQSSHELDNTEWLHVRILEAHLRAQYAPESLGATSIAGLDFGNQTEPHNPTVLATDDKGQPLPLDNIKRALWEQTHERLEFAPAPDPVVADLLFDLGNLAYLQDDTNDAKDVMELALSYGPRRAGLAQKRYDTLTGKPNYPLIFGLMALISGGLLTHLWRKKRDEKREWQQMPVEDLDVVAPQRKAICIEFKD